MKILILSDDFPPRGMGGAASVAMNVARGMKSRGHEVVVITSVRSPQDAAPYEIQGIHVHPFVSSYHERWRAYRSFYNPVAVRFVASIFKQEKPDVVHAHNVHYHISYHALKLAKEAGTRVILTAHDCMLFHYGKFMEFTDPTKMGLDGPYNYKISPWLQFRIFRLRYNPFRNMLIRYHLRFVDVICAVSTELKKVLEANGIHNSVVVHNALDLSSWKLDPLKVATFLKLHKLENYKRILFAGNLTKAKGGHELVQALKLAIAKVGNIALIVVGQKDAYTEELAQEAQKARVHTLITGWLQESDLPAVYAATDIVAFPSICFDTFGMVNLEAMVSKKPVIATCFGGAQEIVKDGETGILVNPYNMSQVADALTTLLSNPNMSREMGAKGHKRLVQEFDLPKQIEAYEKLYHKK